MKGLALTIFGAGLAGLIAGPVWADGTPSSKATFAFSELIALEAEQDGEGSTETPWTDVLEVNLKTANKKDLLIIPSLQCGLVTDGTVKSKGGGKNETKTRSQIRVRIKVTLSDDTFDFAVPSNGSDATFAEDVTGITYCDRIQTLEAKFAGLNCTVDSGVVTCADPEELRLILETLNANAFVFAFDDVLSGVTTITVQAKALAEVELDGADGSLGAANAFIGAGAVSVEEVRFIKDLELDFDA